MSQNDITFVLIVKNGTSTLKKTLEAIKTWPHCVICDTGSCDGTQDLIKTYPHIQLYEQPFLGFGKARNDAANLATTPWVFALDADEVPSDKLLKELSTLALDQRAIYSVKRDNYFWGQLMRGCSGWSNDWVLRLYHKDSTSYSQDLVHEKVLSSGFKIIPLKNRLSHTPYQNLKSMLNKMNHYSDLFAQNSTKKVTLFSPYLHALHAFFKSYLLKKGFTQGYRGLILSQYIAHTTFYKYLKLFEKKLDSKS